jgi:hypothetical protein
MPIRDQHNDIEGSAIAKELDTDMERWVDRDQRVQEQEAELQKLKKRKNLNKKDLQVQRNRITA